jgi:hypothetical protein
VNALAGIRVLAAFAAVPDEASRIEWVVQDAIAHIGIAIDG